MAEEQRPVNGWLVVDAVLLLLLWFWAADRLAP